MGRVLVARIVDGCEAQVPTQGLGLVAPQRQDRVPRSVSVRRQAGPRRTTQQVDHDRLGSIIEGVSRCDLGWQRAVASLPRPGLEVRTRVHDDGVTDKVGPELLGKSANQVGFGRGAVAQTMVNMVCGDRALRRDSKHQQRGRVRPARHRTRQGGARRRKRTARQQVGADGRLRKLDRHELTRLLRQRARRPGQAKRRGRGSRPSSEASRRSATRGR